MPKQIIDTQIGQDAIFEEFVNSSVPAYFRQAVADEDLAPITDPDIDVQQLEPGKPFVFSATVEVRPRLSFEESDYTGISVTKPPVEVTERRSTIGSSDCGSGSRSSSPSVGPCSRATS